jgi:phosphatidate phosphatase PAH1
MSETEKEVKRDTNPFLTKEKMQEIREDLAIEYSSTMELKGLCMKVSSQTQVQAEAYHDAKRAYKKLKRKLDKKFAEKFTDIKINGYKNIAISSASDITKLVNADQEFSKLKAYADDAELAVEFLESTVKQFVSKSWKLRDLIEIEKLDAM